MPRTILRPAASQTVTATSTGATLTSPSGVHALLYVDNTDGANDVSLINDDETPAHSARRVTAGQRGGPFGPYDPLGAWPTLYAATSTSGVRVSYDEVVSE